MLDGEWDLNDVAQIAFRKINFSMDAAQWTTARILRQTWTFIPPTSDCTDVGPVMKRYQDLPEEVQAKLPLNPDTRTLQNPWRDTIY